MSALNNAGISRTPGLFKRADLLAILTHGIPCQNVGTAAKLLLPETTCFYFGRFVGTMVS